MDEHIREIFRPCNSSHETPGSLNRFVPTKSDEVDEYRLIGREVARYLGYHDRNEVYSYCYEFVESGTRFEIHIGDFMRNFHKLPVLSEMEVIAWMAK